MDPSSAGCDRLPGDLAAAAPIAAETESIHGDVDVPKWFNGPHPPHVVAEDDMRSLWEWAQATLSTLCVEFMRHHLEGRGYEACRWHADNVRCMLQDFLQTGPVSAEGVDALRVLPEWFVAKYSHCLRGARLSPERQLPEVAPPPPGIRANDSALRAEVRTQIRDLLASYPADARVSRLASCIETWMSH